MALFYKDFLFGFKISINSHTNDRTESVTKRRINE